MEATIILLLIGGWSAYRLITCRSKRTLLDQWLGVALGVGVLAWLICLAVILNSN